MFFFFVSLRFLSEAGIAEYDVEKVVGKYRRRTVQEFRAIQTRCNCKHGIRIPFDQGKHVSLLEILPQR